MKDGLPSLVEGPTKAVRSDPDDIRDPIRGAMVMQSFRGKVYGSGVRILS